MPNFMLQIHHSYHQQQANGIQLPLLQFTEKETKRQFLPIYLIYVNECIDSPNMSFSTYFLKWEPQEVLTVPAGW